MSDCAARSSAGIPCDRDAGHKGKHGFDSAYGGWVEFSNGFVPEAALRAAEAEMDELQRRLDAALIPYDPATAHALRAVRAERDELRGLLEAILRFEGRAFDRARDWFDAHPAIPEGTPGEGKGRL